MKNILKKLVEVTGYLAIIAWLIYLGKGFYSTTIEATTEKQSYKIGYNILTGYDEVIFVAYGNDPSKTPLQNRDIKTLNKENAPNAFGQRLQSYRKITPLEGHDNIFLIEYLYYDHGDFTNSYGMVYDPKNDKILYDSKDMLNLEDHRFGSITQLSSDELELCYTINWYKDPQNRERVCKAINLFNFE